jgi:hypothetical protein
MTKIIAHNTNCFSAFLASLLDDSLENFKHCSTENDDWKEQTEAELARRNLYMAEVHPGLVSQLPHGALVGAHINGVTRKHIVVAKVLRYGPKHGFEVAHDPSQLRKLGTSIQPQRIVLLCKLDK